MNTHQLLQDVITQADQMVKELEMGRVMNRQLQENLEACRQEVKNTLDIVRAKEEEILVKQSLIEKLQLSLQDREHEINRLKLEKTEVVRRKEELEANIEELSKSYDELKNDFDTLKNQMQSLRDEIEKAEKAKKSRHKKKSGDEEESKS
ncbi:MAG: hypothetical protein HPY80_00060 [Bacteroidales bacterium]|mgnify:CR=1 FL=1|jgi:chromosome segregation ATPase|nr:hypothetical protein [Bacteroidales bacterium]NPV35039.1 hypothetical protein [Bacteroidales bacterium]